jgi:hypothetical protein
MSNTAARTITVPADSTTNFPIGTIIYVANINTGAVTIAPASTVTVSAQGTLRVLNGANSTGMLIKRAANAWLFTVTSRGLG